MSTSDNKHDEVAATRVAIVGDHLEVKLVDGRVLQVPLSWFPRLAAADAKALNNHVLIGGGTGIHWPTVDEDISVRSLLDGRGSMESQLSFESWQKSQREVQH